MKYGPHKSSLFELDANIAALLVYILPLCISFLGSSLSAVVWIIPLLAFIMEKKSGFVTFHAANSLSFYVIDAILYIISSLLGISAIISTWISNIAFIGVITAGITGITFLIIGIVFSLIHIYLFIGQIIGAIKAYDYEEVNFPIIQNITLFILKSKR